MFTNHRLLCFYRAEKTEVLSDDLLQVLFFWEHLITQVEFQGLLELLVH